MKRRTKIVCTLGPAVDSPEMLEGLLDAGMNIARINCSHGDWETRNRWVKTLRGVWTGHAPLGILADLQGPKIRIGMLMAGQIDVESGQEITITPNGDSTLTISNRLIFDGLAPNDRVLLGDGNVELKILSHNGEICRAKVLSGGVIRSKQGITVVGRSFAIPSLTDQDRADVEQAAAAGVDYIALSYVRNAEDMLELREWVDKFDPRIRLCAKIETREALKNIDSIARVSDLIMVARGDLGLQMDIEDVPMAQKTIIQKCTQLGKPVITATQMLESMIEAARPTRAEASDVANAVLDGTDALMLSGETAAGKYPIEAAKMMARIAERAEEDFDHQGHFDRWDVLHSNKETKHTEAVAQAAVQLAMHLKVKAIVCTSTSGRTPQLVAKFRPPCPILVATFDAKTQAQLSASWGVEAVLISHDGNTDATIAETVAAFVRTKNLKPGDSIVVTAGVPAGVAGNTNLVMFQTV